MCAVAQRLGCVPHVVGNRRVHRLEQRTDRHRRHDVGALVPVGHPVAVRRHRDRSPVGVLDFRDGRLELDLRAALGDELGGLLPHLAGSVLGIVELLDEAGDLLALAAARLHPLRGERVDHRAPDRQVLDALRAPVGLDLGARHAPDLLALRLEEVLVEPPAEPRGDETLQRGLVLRRLDPHPEVRGHAAHGFDRSEVRQSVLRVDRVVVELAAVVDAAHAGTAQELVGAEDLEPEVVDRLHLGEEPVPTDVEAPPVAHRGAADATHDRVGLEHRGGHAALRQHVGRGEAGRPRPDDDDVVVGFRCGFAHRSTLRTGRCFTRVREGSDRPASRPGSLRGGT